MLFPTDVTGGTVSSSGLMLCRPAIKVCEVLVVYLHAFLSCAVERDVWSASRSDLFTPRRVSQVPTG